MVVSRQSSGSFLEVISSSENSHYYLAFVIHFFHTYVYTVHLTPFSAHPIGMAVDGDTSTWWQAPSLQLGSENHFVTITVDLKRVFQVGYVLLQAAKSPRPGNWILERSLDGGMCDEKFARFRVCPRKLIK